MIHVHHLSKCFGEHTVLKDINVVFGKGKIHGVVGRNGSGKTVLFKAICGLVTIEEGAVYINGEQIGKEIEMPRSIGVIINEPGFISNMSGISNLKLLAAIKGKAKGNDIEGTMRMVGLDPDERKHVGKYSLGMKQRLAIAQAIMENPEVLIFDEPMNGLDNNGVTEMRELFKRLRAQGKTILLSSHNSSDIDELCDSVYEIDSGTLRMKR